MESDFLKTGIRNLKNQFGAIVRKPEYIIIFSLACGIRIIALILSVDQIGLEGILNASPDAVLYMNMARDLLDGTTNYEHGFFTFGPGFAWYLYIVQFILGRHLIFIILLNILFSGLSCCLLYRLAKILTNSGAIAITAGILLAISHTSIMLSIVVLSDTIYFFVFLLGLILYLRSLETGHRLYFIISGLLTGGAILIRSIGQFWPLTMIIIALTYLIGYRKESKIFRPLSRKLIIKIGVAVIIPVLLMSIWIVRNYSVHGIPALAMTGSGGVANVAVFTLERLEGRKDGEIRSEWWKQYRRKHNIKTLTLADHYKINLIKARETFSAHKREMLKTYWDLTWNNLTDISYMHRLLLPDYNKWTIAWEYKIKNGDYHYFGFYFAVIGLAVLLIRRRFRAFIILGGIYLYYASTIGFTRWQGSRLFYPGLIAEYILISIVIVSFFVLLYKVYGNRTKIIEAVKNLDFGKRKSH